MVVPAHRAPATMDHRTGDARRATAGFRRIPVGIVIPGRRHSLSVGRATGVARGRHHSSTLSICMALIGSPLSVSDSE
jgi:hypothetical protein